MLNKNFLSSLPQIYDAKDIKQGDLCLAKSGENYWILELFIKDCGDEWLIYYIKSYSGQEGRFYKFEKTGLIVSRRGDTELYKLN